MVQKKPSEKLKQLRKDFINSIDEFSKDSAKWLDFLDFASQIDNYDFKEKVCIYLQNPKATYLDKYEKWREKGCKLAINAKRIYLSDGNKSTFFVYDHADIIGAPPKLWQTRENLDIINAIDSLRGKDDIKEFLSKQICGQERGLRERLTAKSVEVIIALLQTRYDFSLEGQRNVSLAGFNISDSIKVGQAATQVANNINERLKEIIIERDKQNDEEIFQGARRAVRHDVRGNRGRKDPMGLGGSEGGGIVDGKGREPMLDGRGTAMDEIYLQPTLQPIFGATGKRDIGRRSFRNADTLLGDVQQLQMAIYTDTAQEGGLSGESGDNATSDGVRKGNSGQRSDLSKSINGEPNSTKEMEQPSKRNVERGEKSNSVGGRIENISILEEEVSSKKDTSSFLLHKANKKEENPILKNFILSQDTEIPPGKRESLIVMLRLSSLSKQFKKKIGLQQPKSRKY